MSGSIIRAKGWQIGDEERYIAVHPNGEIVSLYQTDNTATNEDGAIVKVVERAGFENIQCLQYSGANTGLVAVGQLDGSCAIFDITNAESAPLTLKPRQARSCNSISFNENGLIAMGYDRGRQDHSIQIWDIRDYVSDGIHSQKGLGTKVFSYVPNESISSISFCPTEPSNFLAGSYKLLREFDLRAKRPVYQLATRCTLSISVDPSNPHIFASNSEDGSLAIWDRRKLSDLAQVGGQTGVLSEGPLLLFHKLLGDYQRRTGGSPYRFSSVVKGEISSLFDGDLVRRWQIGVVPPLASEIRQYESIVEQNRAENPNFASRIPQPRDSLFISKVSDVRTKYERVISFDYAPSLSSDYGIDLVCMRQSGSVYKMPVLESQTATHFNSYNGLTFTGPRGTCTKFLQNDFSSAVTITDATAVVSLSKEISRVSVSKPSVDDDNDNDSVLDIFVGGVDRNEAMRLTSNALLENDICSVIRKRAVLGYGADSGKNMTVLDSLKTLETQSQLRNTWKWIDISHELISSGEMAYKDFDFGYLGVWGVWNVAEDFDAANRYYGSSKVSSKSVMAAVRAIVSRRSKEIKAMACPVIGFKGSSAKELQRRLAMYVIGWDFSAQELEDKYSSLISRGNYERAAGWAVFHGDIERAVSILGSSKKESFRIISTAVAAYSAFKDTPTNSAWKDQCRQLASELEDPYLRVIFAYIADGNWWDVLDESALPLRERLGVALRFLKDSELDLYLDRLVKDVTKRGEVEGMIVTGITPEGIDLLQSFVDRTSDSQSACLIASYACPKYFKDSRVDAWAQSYRCLLNSWSMFAVRAKFDVARRKLSRRINGQLRTEPVPRQVYLQCTNCHKSISEKDKDVSSVKIPGQETKFGSHACPHCGYPLPRCAICLITEGMPVPKELIHVDVSEEDMTRLGRERPAAEGFTSSGGDDKTVPVPQEVTENGNTESQFKEWFSFCLSCNHCMHAGHAEEWFSKHYVCPVPDCNCKCNNR
ncbi:DEKNAAC103369 [Brettanomyces naardenensis]|uniref:DEKNAAC103369 n=1 Tax=Brettanomyces naardenensis TaxID=13370 RepID=A0A448YNM7_BRENA|nr:DEKNAAC103369 [Brettanomyces naardenensis]